jgi:hypothetical protein
MTIEISLASMADHMFWERQKELLTGDCVISFWCDLLAEFNPKTEEQKLLAAAIQRTIEKLDEEDPEPNRPAVQWFAQQMERRLRENQHREELPRPNGAFCVNRSVMNIYQMAAAPKSKEADHAADAANWLLLMLGRDVNER